ncbi:hypothetical protein [Clostridium amazonitimonense]|uniref:hypothetical protein n=1 Tax=Clostridium amazonitimonense TaxID=1499689 RepID=UPI0005098727|nr:hypothetical protein [Clostridium amazonitimonense]
MNSPIYNEWVEEERREAAEKAAKEASLKAEVETTKKNIIDLLVEKFDFIPKEVRECIERINDILVLNELFKKSVKTITIEDFQKILEKAMKINRL